MYGLRILQRPMRYCAVASAYYMRASSITSRTVEQVLQLLFQTSNGVRTQLEDDADRPGDGW